MASITVILESACQSGGHLHLNITGDKAGNLDVYVDDIRGGFDQGELEQFIKSCCKVVLAGKTRAQAKTAMQTGFTVTIA